MASKDQEGCRKRDSTDSKVGTSMTEATQTLAGVDPNHLDGVAVLRVLLEQETGLEIYPRQIVIVRDIGEEEFIYSHGVPDTTALTAATTVQHKRMRRALIRR